MELAQIEAVEWIGGERFRLHFADGVTGIVDLGPELGDDPGALAVVREKPGSVTVAPRGRALVWPDPNGEEVDLCADALRRMMEPARAAAE
jgi:hypothetical protein